MAHVVIVEDARTGDMTDVHWYCSDFCAKDDSHYAGWNGCVEIHDHPESCHGCGEKLPYNFCHPRTHVSRQVYPWESDYDTAWRWE